MFGRVLNTPLFEAPQFRETGQAVMSHYQLIRKYHIFIFSCILINIYETERKY